MPRPNLVRGLRHKAAPLRCRLIRMGAESQWRRYRHNSRRQCKCNSHRCSSRRTRCIRRSCRRFLSKRSSCRTSSNYKCNSNNNSNSSSSSYDSCLRPMLPRVCSVANPSKRLLRRLPLLSAPFSQSPSRRRPAWSAATLWCLSLCNLILCLQLWAKRLCSHSSYSHHHSSNQCSYKA